MIKISKNLYGYKECEEGMRYIYIYMSMVSEPSGREVGFVLGVLAYPRIGSSVPRSASLAGWAVVSCG